MGISKSFRSWGPALPHSRWTDRVEGREFSRVSTLLPVQRRFIFGSTRARLERVHPGRVRDRGGISPTRSRDRTLASRMKTSNSPHVCRSSMSGKHRSSHGPPLLPHCHQRRPSRVRRRSPTGDTHLCPKTIGPRRLTPGRGRHPRTPHPGPLETPFRHPSGRG